MNNSLVNDNAKQQRALLIVKDILPTSWGVHTAPASPGILALPFTLLHSFIPQHLLSKIYAAWCHCIQATALTLNSTCIIMLQIKAITFAQVKLWQFSTSCLNFVSPYLHCRSYATAPIPAHLCHSSHAVALVQPLTPQHWWLHIHAGCDAALLLQHSRPSPLHSRSTHAYAFTQHFPLISCPT